MRRILLTGASGFIGRELVERLCKDYPNYEVKGLVRYSSNRTVNLPCETIYGDLTDYALIRKIVKTIDPTHIIHLGAITPVSLSFERPIEYTRTNYEATVNLIESANLYCSGLEQFITASTSETYGIQQNFPINENAELRPNTPYSIAKTAAEFYIKEYMGKAYEFPYVVVKPFNSYGRKYSDHYVTERSITQMLRGRVAELGDPAPIRDFMYVSDHVNGYVKVLEKGITKEVVNLCTGKGVSIREYAEKIKELLDYKGEIRWNVSYQRPTEIPKLIGDNSKAKKLLGWEPKVDLETGLRACISHWKKTLGV